MKRYLRVLIEVRRLPGGSEEQISAITTGFLEFLWLRARL